jgi:uncharacterized membrane protein
MMSSSLVIALLWAAAIGSGLIAGLYFAFSTFIMRAFGSIDTSHAVAAMNSINETIVRSLFMPLFFGSTLISVALVVIALLNWGQAGAGLMLVTGAVYFLGMFVCTLVFNVPLNNRLAGVNPDSADTGQVWSHYLVTWTRWNHIRTVSSLTSCVLSIWLLSTE